MATAEIRSAHPVHNKQDADERNKQIRSNDLARGNWVVYARGTNGRIFRVTKFEVRPDGSLVGEERDGNKLAVSLHWLENQDPSAWRAAGYRDAQSTPVPQLNGGDQK